MEKNDPSGSGSEVRCTNKDTIAAAKLADMERIFHMIEVEDHPALEKMLISGRAFHLGKGLEVYVTSEAHREKGILRLRLKGSITEFWASVSSVA
ncbi:MAG: hypothetical protein RDU20_18860 [Desulfomonilaceae bacterium]|nr:hypothetical protein [Desulfomonilaceae bacterium]